MTNDLATEAAKLSPPAIVSTLTLGGVALSQWVLAATLIYTVLQIILLIPKAVQFIRKVRNASDH